MARFAWIEAKQLDNTLQSLDDFFVTPPVTVHTLTGGLTNRCWKLITESNQSYVWRPHTSISQAFSISRHQEFQVLRAIESTHLGPKPVLVNEQGLLVSFVEGECMSAGASFDSILKTAVSIHRFDTSALPLIPFSFTARVDHYWMQLSQNFRTPEFEAVYQQWRSAPNIPAIELSLCHFDLGCYNLVKTAEGLKVIDWEYATLSDPRLDLMLTIEAAEEPVLESVYRYCLFRQIADVDGWVEGVQAWQPRVKMMGMLWYLLAHQLWGDEHYLYQANKLRQTFCS
ncbi:thiamine kinase [Vibrio genomosp. F6]|uniref:phosphotransferase n=1 Tax=Vibrio genomosp. F6 TaxID=723172 RepID=UPI0010BD8B9E|nr:phosphotransferase [Vibrio genomosp. F6]TKF24050.1 thiamine kinase [Vibrio genomosp. F6]